MTNHINEADRPFIVCPVCAGKGTTGPGWVLTSQDVDEMGHEFYDYMDDMQAGRFDVACPNCNMLRVVKAECACQDCEDEREEIWQLEAMERAERAFGC
jgi:hypothetical protein